MVLNGELDVFDLILEREPVGTQGIDWYSIGHQSVVDEDGEEIGVGHG